MKQSGLQLVIGASGQVGGELMRVISARGREVAGTYCGCKVPGLSLLDIRDVDQVTACIEKHNPQRIYLTSSLTHVDGCQTHPKEGYAVNVQGVLNVIQAADRVEADIVYFSSDYVFDGQAGPYREDDTSCPINEYGKQKCLAEQAILLRRHDLVIRTTLVYGWERQGKNFVARFVEALKNGNTCKVPDDQFGTPTYTPDLAEAVVQLAEAGADGIYHVAGTELASRYEFALEAAQAFGLDRSLVQGISTHELNLPAPRPLKSGLLVDKASARLGRALVGFKEGLSTMANSELERQAT